MISKATLGSIVKLCLHVRCAQAAPFFDKLVFSKVKARLGGRVRLIVSGGAPLAPHVEEFLKVAMCTPVVQVGWVSYALFAIDSFKTLQ